MHKKNTGLPSVDNHDVVERTVACAQAAERNVERAVRDREHSPERPQSEHAGLEPDEVRRERKSWPTDRGKRDFVLDTKLLKKSSEIETNER